MTITLSDGRTNLYQWDTGRAIVLDFDAAQCHFENKAYGRTVDVEVKDKTAIIPDVLLQKSGRLRVFAFVGTPDDGYTKIEKLFDIIARNKPADYVFTPTEQITLEAAVSTANDAKKTANAAKEIADSVRADADAGKFNGAQGIQGEKGEKGDKGETGAKGDKGDTGATGATGAKGDKGDKGDTGAAGADGQTPYIGANGNWWIGDVDTGKPSRGEKGEDGYTPTRHYGARWNKTQAQMTRLYDAASFQTDITNFAHRGSVNANYSNPFDNIYPWAGIKLCNISIDLYRSLAAGDSITKCVTAWEGDVDFSYNDANGVWRYRPEFWGKSWEDDTYRYFDVSEKAIGSYVRYPEAIVGRWHGRKETRTIGDAEKDCLIPSVGMPVERYSSTSLHTYAQNYGATIDSIYSVDADTLLCIVEFATMNTQNSIGNGVSSLYRQSSDLIKEDATNSTTVKVLAAAGSAYCIPGAIFAIGTSKGGTQVGLFVVVSATPNVGDAQYLDVTLDQAVTVTAANYWSVNGLVNVADEAIGSKSGYIGTDGKCNAYYRGIVMFGNKWFYTLGAYVNKDDRHVWIANSDVEADNYDALDTTVHYDTGLVLSGDTGYIKELGLLSRSGLLSIPAFCTKTGGDSNNPVGDYNLVNSGAVFLRGGNASNKTFSGTFCISRFNEAWYSFQVSARPRLKNP